MARITFILLSFLIIALVANVQSKSASLEEQNIVDVDHEEPENELDKKIKDLRQKVKDLVDQGKDNEKAFLGMSEKVKIMDSKVKAMTERLKKINQADYLNAGAEEIEKL